MFLLSVLPPTGEPCYILQNLSLATAWRGTHSTKAWVTEVPSRFHQDLTVTNPSPTRSSRSRSSSGTLGHGFLLSGTMALLVKQCFLPLFSLFVPGSFEVYKEVWNLVTGKGNPFQEIASRTWTLNLPPNTHRSKGPLSSCFVIALWMVITEKDIWTHIAWNIRIPVPLGETS